MLRHYGFDEVREQVPLDTNNRGHADNAYLHSSPFESEG